MVLLSGISSAQLTGTDRLTRQIDHRVEQIEAPNQTATPVFPVGVRCAEDLLEEVVELAEPADDDERTKHYLLRLGIAGFESPTGLYDSSADRAETRFRLRAFASRGSPSA